MILCETDKIKQCTTGPDDVVVGCSTDRYRHKNPLELFVVSPSPLSDFGNSILPTLQSWMEQHCLKLTIERLLARDGHAPFLEVIFDDPLVELV